MKGYQIQRLKNSISVAICVVTTIFVGRDLALEAAKKHGETIEERAPITMTM